MNSHNIPIKDKFLLTIREAAEYSNIGITYCSFVIFNGNRKLVKRKEFEKYLSENRTV